MASLTRGIFIVGAKVIIVVFGLIYILLLILNLNNLHIQLLCFIFFFLFYSLLFSSVHRSALSVVN